MRPTELRPDRRSFVSGLVALLGAGAASHSVGQTPAADLHAIKPIDLVFASALDAARAIRRKQVSSTELIRHILARIEKCNGRCRRHGGRGWPTTASATSWMTDTAPSCPR